MKWLSWKVVWLGWEKNTQQNRKGQKSGAQKGWLCYNVELTQGQESDEKTQPILWTEQSTGALVGAGSLWPTNCCIGKGYLQRIFATGISYRL